MSLTTEERDILIDLYWKKSVEFMDDARFNFQNEKWNTVANRMYYSLFHAVNALLVKDGLPAATHKGMKAVFGKTYVVTGLFPIEDAHFIARMENMRNKADYDCAFSATKDYIEKNFPYLISMLDRIKLSIDDSRRSAIPSQSMQ